MKRDGYGKVTQKYRPPGTEEEHNEKMRKKEFDQKKDRDVTWFNPTYSRQL